jgi:protein-tyrosine phosphatase
MEPRGRGDEHKFRYSQITDKIYIGSDFCKGGVCLLHSEEFKALGVSVELNLSQEENELPPKELEVYCWLPVSDGNTPSPQQFDIGSGIINDGIEAGKTVYVHCKNGHGRSPSVVVAYLIRFKGYTVADAVSLIEEKRPESHIEEIQKEALQVFAEKWSK